MELIILMLFWRPNRTEKIINTNYQDSTYNTDYADDEKKSIFL